MRYEDSMKGVADQIIKEQQRVSKIKNNPEDFHWHDEYATLNFFRFICKNIGNLGNGEIEKMVTRLKSIDQKAVENHVNGAVWAFDYDKTPEEVRREMQIAIDAGFDNPNPAVQEEWKKMTLKGERPTPEEVINYAVKKLKGN